MAGYDDTTTLGHFQSPSPILGNRVEEYCTSNSAEEACLRIRVFGTLMGIIILSAIPKTKEIFGDFFEYRYEIFGTWLSNVLLETDKYIRNSTPSVQCQIRLTFSSDPYSRDNQTTFQLSC
jgi:hypothetical protein